MNFKLGFGPMSNLIVDIMIDYSNQFEQPLMIIASRNQVDADSGYVMSTRELSHQFHKKYSPYVILCRDHCGPYFLDNEKSLSQKAAVEATKKTIANDIENGFQLIHIDTSRAENAYQIADELFEFTLKLNPNIWFEFGTEENVGVAAAEAKYKQDVEFAKQYPNVKFVVAQTGSLTMEDRQIGSFEFGAVKNLVEHAEQNSIRLKEHNADYLTADQILLRRQAGVHACNIAPQLGVIQTRTVLKLANYYGINTSEFKQRVLGSQKWQKWMLSDDVDLKIDVAGHYCFNTVEYRKLMDQIEQLCNFKLALQKYIEDCLNLYYHNL